MATMELVALRRELLCWPATLASTPTARYRGNFFVALTASPTSSTCVNIAQLLSAMLGIPVRCVRTGSVFRCLKLRIAVEAPQSRSEPMRTDRESRATSPAGLPPIDPRAHLVLNPLLQGEAASVSAL